MCVHSRRTLVVLALIVVVMDPSLAQSPIVATAGIGPTAEEIGPGDPFPSLFFGATVAIGDRVAMASIPGETALSANEFGRVAVFERSGEAWLRTATLIGAEESGGHFGRGIDVRGHDAVITSARAIYLFERRGQSWVQTAKAVLKSPDASFTSAVVLGHDAIAASVNEADSGGVVHIYRKQSHRRALTRSAVLRQRDGLADRAFGASLAMHGRLLVVGAPGASGVAYVYLNFADRWLQIDRLTPSDSAPDDEFGAAVGVQNGVIVVGAPGADLGVLDEEYGRLRGDAYVFRPARHGWRQWQKLSSGYDPYFFFGVGRDVALGRDMLALRRNDLRGLTRGEDAVLVFDWTDQQFQFGREVASYEGAIRDIDMSGRRLIYSMHEGLLFSYYVLGRAGVLKFGSQPSEQ